MEEQKERKARMRKQILKERNSLSEEVRHRMDKQIFEELIRYDEKEPCAAYLSYVNYKSEVSTKKFILWCLEKEKTVFVPKVFVDPSFHPGNISCSFFNFCGYQRGFLYTGAEENMPGGQRTLQ